MLTGNFETQGDQKKPGKGHSICQLHGKELFVDKKKKWFLPAYWINQKICDTKANWNELSIASFNAISSDSVAEN